MTIYIPVMVEYDCSKTDFIQIYAEYAFYSQFNHIYNLTMGVASFYKVDLTAYVEKHEFCFDAVLNEHVTNDEVIFIPFVLHKELLVRPNNF